MLLHDMKFRITEFELIEPSPWVLLFQMHFLVSTRQLVIFQISQWNPYFDYWRHKNTFTFSAMKSF